MARAGRRGAGARQHVPGGVQEGDHRGRGAGTSMVSFTYPAEFKEENIEGEVPACRQQYPLRPAYVCTRGISVLPPPPMPAPAHRRAAGRHPPAGGGAGGWTGRGPSLTARPASRCGWAPSVPAGRFLRRGIEAVPWRGSRRPWPWSYRRSRPDYAGQLSRRSARESPGYAVSRQAFGGRLQSATTAAPNMREQTPCTSWRLGPARSRSL